MGINAMGDGKTESRTQRGIRLISEMLGEESKTRMELNAAAGFGARFTRLAVDFVFGTMWADAELPRRDLSLVRSERSSRRANTRNSSTTCGSASPMD